MARPCGCAGGGCTARGINGINVVGTCGVNDPLTIGLDDDLGAGCEPVMDCVGGHLGAGLNYSDPGNQISTYVSGDEGNTLGYGSDGGLLATGSTDPGLGGVSVGSLPAANVLGGLYGAGYARYPEGTAKAYEAAMGLPQVAMVHAPVRRAEDGTLWALDNRNVATYAAASGTVDQWGQEDGQYVTTAPSGNPTAWGGGYFGFYAPTEPGLLEVQDVFRITQRRKVLYLENKDLGGSGSTLLPETTLRQLADLIIKWGLQKSVIVGSDLPTSNADTTGIKAGLSYCRSLGIEIAASISSTTVAAANLAADLVAAGYTWAMVNWSVPATTITSYRDAGLNVMMTPGDRQWQWASQNSLGLRGMLCTDPVYASAATYGYNYRPVNPSASAPHPWSRVSGGPDFGRVGYNASIAGSHSQYRGVVVSGEGGMLQFPPAALPQGNSNYLIPAGRWNPIYDPNLPAPPPGNPGAPTNYDIECGVSITSPLGASSGMAIGLFFGMPLDVRNFDLSSANADTKGYCIVLTVDGQLNFRRYDGIPGSGQYSLFWASTWTTVTTERRIHVAVRPGQITISRAEAIGGTGSKVFNAATGGGDVWRGPYFYLAFFRTSGHIGNMRYHNLKVTNY